MGFFSKIFGSPQTETANIPADELFSQALLAMKRNDTRRGLVLMEQAANNNSIAAQLCLGSIYHEAAERADNVSRDRDAATALYWYKRAADLGDSNAQCIVGIRFKNGQGTEKNDVQAAKYFSLAANQGNAPAQHYLAIAYEMGDGVAKNHDTCMYWLKKSAQQNYSPAITLLKVFGKRV